MKIKKGFMLREIVGQWVVVPLGDRVVEFNGIMTLSESGALLWRILENDVMEEVILQAVLKEYDIDEETARIDIQEFIMTLKEKDLLESDDR